MDTQKHPRGLYVLFFTEMWERFSFYSMLAMFTLYLKDPKDGFGWTSEQATTLYSNYLMFVYASPAIGGFLADRGLGYRRSVMIGGFFFMAGHLLLSFPTLTAVYAALTCLVIGNGFFKPNVSTMVGNLYPEGSPLKDRAYNFFYMGINVGALLAPIVMEVVKSNFGFHPAFAVAAFGMVISVSVLWRFKHLVEDPGKDSAQFGPSLPTEGGAWKPPASEQITEREGVTRSSPAVTRDENEIVDLPPDHMMAPHGSPGSSSAGPTEPRWQSVQSTMEAIPEWRRIAALLVIFLCVIVFWMVFHQNGATLTYWGDDNTDWQVSGIISNAINPFWVITLTFPLIWFWGWLAKYDLEPSTPMKMVMGMFLSGASFFIMYAAARQGEAMAPPGEPYSFKVSPMWLLGAYAVLTLAELMLSPMGLSLVSKVAPIRYRGLMMGGWFVATAVGNKLVMIGVLWDRWLHSSFFALLGALACGMGIIMLLLVIPLKRSMPGV